MIRKGLKDAVPIIAGYFPIAMAFGILAGGAGINQLDGVLISAIVYAGASQFMAVSMLSTGMGPVGIIFAVFFMNFRHFIMSASVRAKLKRTKKRYFPVIGFFLTDESYSIISFKDDIDDPKYLITLEVSAYLSWVAGTAAGYIFGGFIPEVIAQSMGIALYALLLALLIPAYKKEKSALLLALLSGGLNTLLIKGAGLESGAGFMLSVICVSVAAALYKEASATKGEVPVNDKC